MKYIRESNSKQKELVLKGLFSKVEEYVKDSHSTLKKLFNIDLNNDIELQRSSTMNCTLIVTYTKNGKTNDEVVDFIDNGFQARNKDIFEIIEEHKTGQKTWIKPHIFDSSDINIDLIIFYVLENIDDRYKELVEDQRILSTKERLEMYKISNGNLFDIANKLDMFDNISKYLKINEVSEIDISGYNTFMSSFNISLKNPIKINVGKYLKQINR